MILVCNVCVPKPNDWDYNKKTKGILVLAKWYPGGFGEEGAAYYTNENDKAKWGEEFFEFLDQHKHGEMGSKKYSKGAGQENPVRIEYESEGLPVFDAKEKKI